MVRAQEVRVAARCRRGGVLQRLDAEGLRGEYWSSRSVRLPVSQVGQSCLGEVLLDLRVGPVRREFLRCEASGRVDRFAASV